MYKLLIIGKPGQFYTTRPASPFKLYRYSFIPLLFFLKIYIFSYTSFFYCKKIRLPGQNSHGNPIRPKLKFLNSICCKLQSNTTSYFDLPRKPNCLSFPLSDARLWRCPFHREQQLRRQFEFAKPHNLSFHANQNFPISENANLCTTRIKMFPWNIAKSAEALFSRWAVKRFCQFVLKKKLGQFILGDIDLDQLDVQLREGTIQLSDLALNVDCLNDKVRLTLFFLSFFLVL